MLKKLLVPLLILPLIVAACGGEQPALLEEAAAAVADTASEAQPTTTPAEEATPVATEEIAAVVETVAVEFTSECTLVSSALDAPEEYAQLFGLTERDWVYGPETAALTIVEYGDFQ